MKRKDLSFSYQKMKLGKCARDGKIYMFNNDVTYAEKWNTAENQAALSKLDKKFFDNSECSPDCPVSWAVEVLELMETIDKKLGFKLNTHTMRGYYIQGNLKDWFITDPWKGLVSSFKHNLLGEATIRDKGATERRSKTLGERFASIGKDFIHPIKYGFRAIKIKYINPIRNKCGRRDVGLSQLKEKYGSLTIYFNAPDEYESWIENEIRKTKIKLALKGAYYPIESLWEQTRSYRVGDEYRPDIISVEHGEYNNKKYIDVTETTYRGAMKELGLNLEEIAAKAEAAKKDIK